MGAFFLLCSRGSHDQEFKEASFPPLHLTSSHRSSRADQLHLLSCFLPYKRTSASSLSHRLLEPLCRCGDPHLHLPTSYPLTLLRTISQHAYHHRRRKSQPRANASLPLRRPPRHDALRRRTRQKCHRQRTLHDALARVKTLPKSCGLVDAHLDMYRHGRLRCVPTEQFLCVPTIQ